MGREGYSGHVSVARVHLGQRGPNAGRPGTSTPLPRPLTHLEPKSKLSSRPRPSLCPQPARALDRRSQLILPQRCHCSPQRPPSPQDWEPIKPGGCTRGQAWPGARRFVGTGPFRPSPRRWREGRRTWCWLTGYIFDTFNELIQTFHTRKDSAVLLPLCFGLGLPFQRCVLAKAVTPPHTELRDRGPAHSTAPSLLPSLGRMDLMRILWPPSVHGGILSFTHVVPIKRQIILKLRSFHSASRWAAGSQAQGP